jgi:ABC-type xylose transport system permease subunit
MENTENKSGLFKMLAERSKAKTPPFFKKLRLVGLTLAAIGGVLVASPVAIPAAIVTIGGYLIVAGSVATAVSQVAVSDEESKKKE